MKTIYFLVYAAAAAAISVSCSRKQEYDLSWLDQFDTELPEELAAFNSTYRLEMTNDIVDVTYSYDGDASLETEYTLATVEQAVAVSEFLDKEVFPLFPEGFVSQYMPATIFVADSVKYVYAYEEYDYADGRMVHSVEYHTRSLSGDIGQRHLTLAASRLTDVTDTEQLRFEWTSLVVERMMSNTSAWETPTEFVNLAENRLTELFGSYFRYYQESLSGRLTTFGMPCSPDEDSFNTWYWCGSFRGARYGYQLNYVYTEAFAEAYSGSAVDSYVYLRPTYRQDFADYVAFILVYGDAGWEEFMQMISGLSYTDTGSGGNETVYTCSSQVYETRAGYVRSYLQSRFGWEI